MNIRRDGRPSLIERLPIEAGSVARTADWGLAGHPALATLIGTPTHLSESAQRDLLRSVRETLEETLDIASAGATVTRDLLLIRLLHHDAETLRSALQHLWQQLRPPLMDCVPSLPRIWAT